MASNSHYLYGIGDFYGEKGKAWQIQNTVYQIFEDNDRWTEIRHLPQPMAESIYTTASENIHVIGGKSPNKNSKNIDSDSHFLLVNNTHWESAAPASISRNSAAGTAIGNRIYVIGGRQSSSRHSKARNLSYSEVYDSTLDKWEKIRALPQALAGLTATSINEKILVTGGEAFGPNGNWKSGKVSNAIWAYDPISDHWSKVAQLNEARHGHGAVAIGENLYIIGGATRVGPQDTLASMVQLNWSR
ncbi:Kelch repeat-containing protein [Microbulbifer epialgicus]|uniref:Kelch repeat-containing protein n=1 Tax=Microbulbifer epialgicus TaxID=393907 RepID=A0ABV4NUZ8_9GAMM